MSSSDGARGYGVLAASLLPFILLATLNSAGYRYGSSDQAFYIPAIRHQLDPSLFPRDWATLGAPVLDLDALPGDARPKAPASRDALLEEFDRKVAAARAKLGETTDSQFLSPWTLKKGDREFFTMPHIAAIRSFVMNHSIHHRGQLSVYLRLNDIPIPPIYGPTADEQF